MTENNSEPRRFTITFKPQALDALERCMEREHLSQTDAINRALRVYDFISARRALGNELLLRLPDSTTETIHII